MVVEALSVATSAVVRKLVDAAFDRLFVPAADHASVEHSIADQAVGIERWSSSIQILNMGRPALVETNTIELTISNRVKRIYTDDEFKIFDESEIFSLNSNFILFGGPGAGKTTTVKRLCRKLFKEEPISETDRYQVPFVIRCRDIVKEENLADYIASLLSVKIEAEDAVKFESSRTQKRLELIAKFLDAAGCFVFIDGLDEYPQQQLGRLMEDIGALAGLCSVSNFLCTTRSGAITNVPNGFSSLFIEPLNEDEKDKIIQKWARRPAETAEVIRASGVNAVIDRPLFLVQILLLIDWHGYVPDKPCEIYDRLVTLVIEIWDNQKGAADGVVRMSRYEKFGPHRKVEFLCSLSYFLIEKGIKNRFSYEDFREFFAKEHSYFELPGYEVDNVLNEIETYTGFIMESSYRKLEFLHSTFQEFLAAKYLATEIADFEKIVEIGKDQPDILAIVIAMARSPAETAAKAMLIRGTNIRWEDTLERLKFELPKMRPSVELGLALLYMLSIPNEKLIGPSGRAAIHRFIARFDLLSSVSMAFERYASRGTYKTATATMHSLTLLPSLRDKGYAPSIDIDIDWLEQVHAARAFAFGDVSPGR